MPYPFPQFFFMSYFVRLLSYLGLMETNSRSQKRQNTIENMTMKNKTRKSNENQLSHDGVKGNILITSRITCKGTYIPHGPEKLSLEVGPPWVDEKLEVGPPKNLWVDEKLEVGPP